MDKVPVSDKDRRSPLFIAALAALLLLGLPSFSLASAEREVRDTQEQGRYIVLFYDWVGGPSALAHEQVEKYGGRLGFVYEHALKGYSAEYPTDVIDELEAEPTVEYVGIDAAGECTEEEEGFCEETGEMEVKPGFGRYVIRFYDWVGEPAVIAQEQVEKYGGVLGHIYEVGLKGYSAEYPTDVIDEIEAEPTVKRVDNDALIECPYEPWFCEEAGTEPDPEPTGTSPPPSASDDSDSTVSSRDPGSESDALTGPVLKRCARGDVRRHGQCVPRSASPRRGCRRRTDRAPRRCLGAATAVPSAHSGRLMKDFLTKH